MEEGSWNVQIPLHTSGPKNGGVPYPRWISSFNPVAYLPVRRDQYSAVTCVYFLTAEPHATYVSALAFDIVPTRFKFPLPITRPHTSARSSLLSLT